jgi:surface protein
MSRFDTSKVTGMSGMFADMPNITTINVSNFDTSKVKNMSSMFSGLSKVTTLNLSNFNTSQVTDMRYMFMDSARLSNINLTSFDTSSLKVGTYDDGAHSMFKGIPATLLYARTQADADRFNNSQNKPDTLTFVVQQ